MISFRSTKYPMFHSNVLEVSAGADQTLHSCNDFRLNPPALVVFNWRKGPSRNVIDRPLSLPALVDRRSRPGFQMVLELDFSNAWKYIKARQTKPSLICL